jgi:hypothetical protein
MCPRVHILRSIVVPHDIVHLHVSRRGRLEQRSVSRRPTSLHEPRREQEHRYAYHRGSDEDRDSVLLGEAASS